MPEPAASIERLFKGENLERKTVAEIFRSIMDGDMTSVQTASFLVALRMKGETPEELTGAAEAMLSRANALVSGQKNAVDLCGTGGDSKGTFNISTTASFIAAGAGVAVAKHGNRSVSSPVGSADVLEAAGVKIDMNSRTARRCLECAGVTFLFAPLFHPSMKNVAQTRREMGVRTVFNMLGPMLNPAFVKRQVIGVPSAEIMNKTVETAANLGLRRCMVVSGKDGMDEITIVDETEVSELMEDRSIKRYLINPEDFGIAKRPLAEIKGQESAPGNAAIMMAVLDNSSDEAKTGISLLNAAAAIYVSGRANDMVGAFKLAKRSLESGAAMSKFRELVRLSSSSGKGATV